MTTTKHTPTPMSHKRVIGLLARANKTYDVRISRRAFTAALRWTDRNRTAGWVLSEYYALRRKAVSHSQGLTQRYLKNARAALAKVTP